MAVSLAAPGADGRISQVLPTVKCSSCLRPVPFNLLVDHVCALQPPVPSIPIPTTIATVLPPQRIQSLRGRVPSPAIRVGSAPLQELTHQRIPPPAVERLRINTTFHPSLLQPSSPLARSADDHRYNPPSATNHREYHPVSQPQTPLSPRHHPAFPQSQPGLQLPGPLDPRQRSLSTAPPVPSHGFGSPGGHPRAPQRSATTPGGLPSPPSVSCSSSPFPSRAVPFVSESQIDTKSGGEAGMAGVGRRGFAAAARAAMLASSFTRPEYSGPSPRSLDTPPLSASSGHSSSPGVSPFPQSPMAPQTPFLPDRRSIKAPSICSDGSGSNIKASMVHSPISPLSENLHYQRTVPSSMVEHESAHSPTHVYAPSPPKQVPPTETVRPESEYSISVYSMNLRSASCSPVGSHHKQETIQRAPTPADSESSEGGLAYARSETENEDETEENLEHASTIQGKANLSPTRTASMNSAMISRGRTELALHSKPEGKEMRGRVHWRQASTSSVSTTSSSHIVATAQTIGLGGRRMAHSSSSGKSSYSLQLSESEAGVQGEDREKIGGGQTRRSKLSESESPKLPTRARTSVARSADTSESGRVGRVCLKCGTKIENGRWIKVDNAAVLCGGCWKNMYLPKCRRCNLPIENQAVSSSDGQLKGKYHRECFNCHVCHKPFPDKSFYVFDGKPLCAYHYHEENNSLCAAARCGQPIEGPCAVSHTGDRYHPEHMTCEYHRGPPCTVQLEEYWEVDGRMLCRLHAQESSGQEEDGWEEDERSWMEMSNARKRVTRFINLE